MFLMIHYTKYDVQCVIIFDVVTTLPYSILIFNSLTIGVRYECVFTFPTAISLPMKHGFHWTCDFEDGTPPSCSLISHLPKPTTFFFISLLTLN